MYFRQFNLNVYKATLTGYGQQQQKKEKKGKYENILDRKGLYQLVGQSNGQTYSNKGRVYINDT